MVILIVVFSIFRFNIFNPISSFFHKIAFPIWKIENSIKNKFTSLQFLVQSKQSLLEENELLKERLEGYRVDLLYKDVLSDENQKLKEIFQRSTDIVSAKNGEEFILGVILSKPNSSPYDTLIIDLGKNLSARTDKDQGGGIKKGDLVFAEGNVLIGQIEEVFKKSSKIKLFSTPGEKLDIVMPARTPLSVAGESTRPDDHRSDGGSESDIYTTLTGRGGGNFEMTLPRDVEIEEGMKALFPSINPYLVAIVGKINYDPRDPFQEILLLSPVNVQHLKFVQVKIGSRL